jgi:6-pyruvoyltetrahydropterin/6-carboxytetrahydropterin synthase
MINYFAEKQKGENEMLTITKRFDFAYGHNLPGYNGACVRQHGHNAGVEVEVALKGTPPANTYPGMIIDFKDLKEAVNKILDEFDHRYLNDLPDFMVNRTPTAENITNILAYKIQIALDPFKVILVRLRVSETPDSWAEWKL